MNTNYSADPRGPEDTATEVMSETNFLTVSGVIDRQRTYTELRMPGGEVVRLPTALLERQLIRSGSVDEAILPDEFSDAITIPVIEEQLTVGKRTVTTGKVRLIKTVQEYQEPLNEPLAVRSYDVERVILNHPVESAPAIRIEGETTIYPVVEEQMILTKRLVLKEEIRVTQRDTERIDTQLVTLQREHVEVERE